MGNPSKDCRYDICLVVSDEFKRAFYAIHLKSAMLLTILLLYQIGFEVGRFIGLEKIVEDSKKL